MRSFFYILVTASLFYIAFAQQPSCNFNFDDNNVYNCPLSGGNIDADYSGGIGGSHFTTPRLQTDNDVVLLYANEAVKEFILKKIFDRFKNLEILEFRKGSLTRISSDFFYNCNRLETVLIKESVFTNVPENIFGNCSGVKNIDFGSNDINNIDTKAFVGLVNLETLKLNDNELATIRPNVFNLLQKLQTLDLSRNKITLFDSNVFSGNIDLRVLILAENKIDRLVTEYFSSLKELTTFDMTKNGVNSTAKAMVENLSGVKLVKFKGNLCIDMDFEDFRDSDVDSFKTCIDNFNGAETLIFSSLPIVLISICKFLYQL